MLILVPFQKHVESRLKLKDLFVNMINKINMKQPFLEFLKEHQKNPIIVPKTDSGKYAIHFDKIWYYDPEFGNWCGFMEYGSNFAETMSMLEEIYYKYEIKII